jgi:hypothetical protein
MPRLAVRPAALVALSIILAACSDATAPAGREKQPDAATSSESELPVGAPVVLARNPFDTTSSASTKRAGGFQADVITSSVDYPNTGVIIGDHLATCRYPNTTVGRQIVVNSPAVGGNMYSGPFPDFGSQYIYMDVWVWKWSYTYQTWGTAPLKATRVRRLATSRYDTARLTATLNNLGAGTFGVTTRLTWAPPAQMASAGIGGGSIDYTLNQASDFAANYPNIAGAGYCIIK